MTQFFDETGKVTPATLVVAGPVVVTQVKTDETDGYVAVQIGFGEKKHVKKPQAGHFGKLGAFSDVRELRPRSKKEIEGVKKGDTFDVTDFDAGDKIHVSGVSKGKGFQGVVKRHGFHGGPRSHGQKHTERTPGSIGATGPQRVMKGKKMAGRMGAERVTVKGLKVLAVDKERNHMLISGAIPGHRGTVIEIRG